MPKQQILPTWLALNNANFPTMSGLQDFRTGQDFPAGGLKVGDYFDLTEQEANTLSLPSIGLLHNGRYRLVKVDSGAIAANIKTGFWGYIRIGTFVQSVVVSAPGTGGTPGTYNVPVPVNQAGGNGASLSVVVGPAGAITLATVTQGGAGYTGPQSALSYTLTGIPGLTGATLVLQLNTTPNLVTDYTSATTQTGRAARPVLFLNSISPGNYGFIQELGVGYAFCNSAVTPPAILIPTGSGLAPTGSLVGGCIGEAIDNTTAAGQFLKFYMQYIPVCQD